MHKMEKKVTYHLYPYELPQGKQLHKMTFMRAPKERMYAVVAIKEQESLIVMPAPVGRDEFMFDFSPLNLCPEEIVDLTFYSCYPPKEEKK